jgi:hypothetical protein
MKKMILLLLLLRGVTSTYAQCISGNCNNGHGTAILKNKGGIRFTGQFLNKKPHGTGVAYYPDGTRYEGEWLNGTMDGIGTLTLNDSTSLSGIWRNSRYLGDDPALSRDSMLAYTPTIPKVVKKQQTESASTESASIESSIPDLQSSNTESKTEDVAVRNDIFPDNSASGNRTRAASNAPVKIAPDSKMWAIAVGVSSYESQNIMQLKYPHSDAYRMYAFWKSPEGGSLDDAHSQVLVNDQATKQGIIDSMRQMFTQAAPNDLVTFFYSGHGLKGAFLPTDYDGNNIRLFHSEINDILATCPAQYKLVIADACNSGSYLASKSVKSEVFYSTGQDAQDVFFRELNRASAGTAFIMSSLADEESLEVSTLHQSIFSYFVVIGMKGAANSNDDDIITVQELFDYVYQNVTSYAFKLGKTQTPIIKGNYDPNMPVAMIRKK